MSDQPKPAQAIFILTGANPQQYTEARRKLDLLPAQTSWLTRPANLIGKQRPKVFRFGDWKSLAKIGEIEKALAAVDAEITDIS